MLPVLRMDDPCAVSTDVKLVPDGRMDRRAVRLVRKLCMVCYCCICECLVVGVEYVLVLKFLEYALGVFGYVVGVGMCEHLAGVLCAVACPVLPRAYGVEVE